MIARSEILLRKLQVVSVTTLLLASLASPVSAEVLITLRNALANPPIERIFSHDEFDALPRYEIRTTTDFTDGVVAFQGPRAVELFEAIGAGSASKARFVAANDYAVEIELEELSKYGVILATTANGARFSPRGKGPVWVMYPLDSHDELQDPIFNNRLIWQVVQIELK